MNCFRYFRLLKHNLPKTTFRRNIASSFPCFTQVKQNLEFNFSFEDMRLQKHLNYLDDLLKDKDCNHNNFVNEHGFSHKILSHIMNLRAEIKQIQSDIEELNLLICDLKKEKDDLYNTALLEKESFENKIKDLKNMVLNLVIPIDQDDEKDIILELSAGVGGQEAMLFTNDMFEMYCRFAEWNNWSYEILQFDKTDLGGVRNANIAISGVNTYKTLKYECGVHRVQRVPKTEKSGRIHTSTMTVAVLPQPTEIDIVILPHEIELEFKKSSGAGGQHVNTTDSCVRIYHKPSGIVVESQVERDQHRNRAFAMKSLRAKLYQRKLEAVQRETSLSRKSQVGTAGRSEKVRTYNFVQDRITDHRAHVSIFGVEAYFRGDETFDRLSNMVQEWSNKQCLYELLNKYDSA